MSCKAIVPKTAVIVFLAMIKVIAIVKFLISKSLKQHTIIVIEEVFWRIKSQIKPKCKQSYFNSKTFSVNLRFSKSASL